MSIPREATQPSALSQWDHGSHSPIVGQQQAHEAALVDDDSQHTGSENQGVVAPDDFRPFFMLIEDSTTGEHHHPHVQYIFSDDDPDLGQASILDSLQEEHAGEATERFLLLDIHNDGKSVASVHSLSPTWQVSQAVVSEAPSWGESTSKTTAGSLMLRIEGAELRPNNINQAETKGQPLDIIARMESVMSGYSEMLAHLESVLKKDALDLAVDKAESD